MFEKCDSHHIDRHEWLLLSAFQQGLRQNLTWSKFERAPSLEILNALSTLTLMQVF